MGLFLEVEASRLASLAEMDLVEGAIFVLESLDRWANRRYSERLVCIPAGLCLSSCLCSMYQAWLLDLWFPPK